jgi:hypothetical protein
MVGTSGGLYVQVQDRWVLGNTLMGSWWLAPDWCRWLWPKAVEHAQLGGLGDEGRRAARSEMLAWWDEMWNEIGSAGPRDAMGISEAELEVS